MSVGNVGRGPAGATDRVLRDRNLWKDLRARRLPRAREVRREESAGEARGVAATCSRRRTEGP
jgi:hypothetical protein